LKFIRWNFDRNCGYLTDNAAGMNGASMAADWWRYLPERIDPVVFSVGVFSLRWYAVCYAAALFSSVWLFRRFSRDFLSRERFADMAIATVFGALVGARLGYVAGYRPDFYAMHPLAIVWPFDLATGAWIGIAGMSYYGGLIGVTLALWCGSKHFCLSMPKLADALALAVAGGYAFGRLGNFLNGELLGRATTLPWGVAVFDTMSGAYVVRHPSPLYEALGEGVFLFAALSVFRKRKRDLPAGALAATYVFGYATVRFCLEFFREPDASIELIAATFSLNQLFSILALGISVSVLWHGKKVWYTEKREKETCKKQVRRRREEKQYKM
jgi:phosphatidylglycerol:prolipoprotein diacylglycerol transferase